MMVYLQVIAVSNPDYNVERTEIISSGHQHQGVGLNLCKPATRVKPDQEEQQLHLDLEEWVGHRVLAARDAPESGNLLIYN